MLIRNDIRRSLTSPRFYISIAVALCILLRPLTEMIGGGGEYTFVYLQEFPFGFSDFTPFAAIFCVLPFADSFCEDFNGGFIHTITARIGPQKYILKRIVSNALIGGLTEGSIVALTLLVCMLGANTPDSPESVSFMQGTPWYTLGLLLRFHGLLFYGLRVLLAFFFGTLWASVGLCVSAFSLNRYVTLVVPFVLYQLLWRLIDHPLFNPVETLSGNAVSSLPLLFLTQLGFLFLCGTITAAELNVRIRP